MKVYRVNDCEWYMAPTLEEAVQACVKDCGLPRDEAVDDPHEVSDADMQRLMFVEYERNTAPRPRADSQIDYGWSPTVPVRRTFADELARRVAAGKGAEAFATTEY